MNFGSHLVNVRAPEHWGVINTYSARCTMTQQLGHMLRIMSQHGGAHCAVVDFARSRRRTAITGAMGIRKAGVELLSSTIRAATHSQRPVFLWDDALRKRNGIARNRERTAYSTSDSEVPRADVIYLTGTPDRAAVAWAGRHFCTQPKTYNHFRGACTT